MNEHKTSGLIRKTIKKLVALVGLLLLGANLQAQDTEEILTEILASINAGFENVEVELLEWPGELHDQLGAQLEFAYLTKPVGGLTQEKVPLIIALHGGGSRWWANSLEERLEVSAEIDKKQGFDLAELAGKELIMIEPNTTSVWMADELDRMLDYVLENFPEIDPNRVYLTGYSAGGAGSWRWLNESAHRFAAAGIGGAGGSVVDDATKLANLPLWLIVGSDDKRYEGMENMVDQLLAVGNENVEYTVIEGGDHGAAGNAYFSSLEMVDWLLGFSKDSGVECNLFNTEEILDESTLDIEILEDWHVDEVTGSTRQKLIEINVAEWWPGQDYRIPVRMIVPLEGKATGFSITGANSYETLMKDSQPTDIQAELLAGGVGIVKTHVKRIALIPGKEGLEQEMERMFMEDFNRRYTTVWIWSMTLMRATTAAYAEVDHFEKGKVAGSGSSKNGISPAVALINDERFTATCSQHAFAYYSPARGGDREVEDCFWSSVRVTENWDRLMERGVDILFQPGTHDYVSFDILWGAQNYPQLPVYYKPNGGHSQTPHVAAANDEQNKDAFLWHHFFGGESLLRPPTSSHIIEKDKLIVRVSFNEGPQPISGRIWWIYDRAPAGSEPFLQVPIPEDQWMDMEYDAETGTWTATIPLKDGFERIDFFSNHGLEVNGYKQYLSSPYTRAERTPLAITSSPAENIIAGETYSYSIETEGEGALLFESSPEADWLSLENSILNGTPQYEDAGTFDVIVAYSNELDTVKQAFTISVTIPLSINSTPMESAIVGEAYIYSIETTGEGSLSFTTLPHADWLSLSENILSGMPEVADTGTVNVSILFTDGSDTAEQAFSITVVSAVSSRSKGLTDQILIWPNPAKELIHISHLPSGVTIELISSSGSVIANYKPVDEYMTIPVSTFTPETYMLRVVEGMDVQTFKFIIER
ncbi:MAG: T9SS type A sorting domain-containing protein [Bacteroidetes bacterium]|nr:T9SS type A sorting domain-containing protein [Bacteroidota bacterium]